MVLGSHEFADDTLHFYNSVTDSIALEDLRFGVTRIEITDGDKVHVTGSVHHNQGRRTDRETASPNIETAANLLVKLVLPSAGQ
jgi:hypothetical protein